MLTNRIKGVLLSVLLLIIAIGLTAFIYMDTNRAMALVEVPVADSDLKKGTHLEEKHLKRVKVNGYSADALGMVKTEEELLGKYTGKAMAEGDFFKKGDLVKTKPSETVGEMVSKGAITISTDTVKCVGGKVKVGDHVKMWLVIKDSQGMRVFSPPGLSKIRVLDIGIYGGDEVKTITLEADESQQQQIVATEHGGKIHMVLLPGSE